MMKFQGAIARNDLTVTLPRDDNAAQVVAIYLTTVRDYHLCSGEHSPIIHN